MWLEAAIKDLPGLGTGGAVWTKVQDDRQRNPRVTACLCKRAREETSQNQRPTKD